MNSLMMEDTKMGENTVQDNLMMNTFSKQSAQDRSDAFSQNKSLSRMKTKTGQKKRDYTPEYKIFIWE